MPIRRCVALAVALAALAAGRTAIAQVDTSPPTLLEHPEAAYPPDALRDRVEANVGLELTVDETGHVADAKVVKPAGHGLDEAALEAVRRFTFDPARQNGRAVKSTIAFTYEFHLPGPTPGPTPSPTPSPTPTPTPTPIPIQTPAAPEVTQAGADQSTLVLAQKPISAASSFAVRDRDFQLRPIGSVQDILRVTPGLLVVQHAGGGKANQYFLRGFDADHGTDLALSVDGIPVNMVSHAHGQGYSDTNFLIPELVERVEITKGPYFVEQGDFATAGAVNLVTRRDFRHSSLGFGAEGSPGYGAPGLRGLLIASPKMGETWHPLFAAEVGKTNGPFDNPERFNKYKLYNKVTINTPLGAVLTLGESSYAGDWYGSGQIPQREVAAGRLNRFGTIDPTEGGDSARHQIWASYKLRPSENQELSALAYAWLYRFNLYSNFTLALRDPDNGDQIEQVDRRTTVGGKVSYRIVTGDRDLKIDSLFGADMRNDDIKNQLFSTRERQKLGAVRDNSVHESSLGAFVREEVGFSRYVRLMAGGRADFFSFAVDDHLEQLGSAQGPTSGVKGASQLSPKTALVVSPLTEKKANLDVYVNYGHGFHSNDARGVVLARDAVTPLTRAVGSELGSRARLMQRWDVAVALWQLDLRSETVWSGDDGTTQASGATRRYGVELETRYEITKWLAADLDLTASHASFVQNAGNGSAVALAPRQTWAGGLSARHPSGFRGGFRFYGVGDRPATQDEALVADGFTVFDLHAGYRHRRFDLALDVENLFNAKYKSAQFATTSRLRGEPSTNAPAPIGTCGNGSRAGPSAVANNFAGCEDVNFTPGYPFTVRLMTTVFLD